MNNHSIKLFFRQLNARDKELKIIVALAVVFFVIYAYFPATQPAKFVSPDATANYFFTKQFAEQSTLSYQEPLAEISRNLVLPRSTEAADGQIVPTSFLGIILIYGSLAKIFTTNIIVFITPLLASLTVIFFYLILKQVFAKRIAFISSLLLYILPAFWYYSSRAMMHQIAFVAFFVMGLYWTLTALKKTKLLYYLLGGLFLGLALIVRTSEIWWVALLLVILFIANRQKMKWGYLVWWALMLGIVFVPILFFNNQLYGSPLATAYKGTVEAVTASGSSSAGLWSKISSLIFPFGISWAQFSVNFWHYFIQYFFWLSLPAVFGFFLYLRQWCQKKLSQPQIVFMISFVIVGLWQVAYYGSWRIVEFEDPSVLILGSSYIRYWLILSIFSLPFISAFILRLATLIKKKWSQVVFPIVVISFLIFFSAQVVLLDPLYGLSKIKQDTLDYQDYSDQLNQVTEDNSVIISGTADKVFWPERDVIVSYQPDYKFIDGVLKPLLKQVSVYFYHIRWQTQSQEFLKALPQYNISYVETSQIDSDLTLYQLRDNGGISD
ncbi:MAG: glycosyltransferase family 39 protein [Patescibacteria group bacterium]